VTISELDFAEEPCLEWLEDTGWTRVHGERFAPTPGGQRERDSDVVLARELRDAIARLNPDVPAEARERAMSTVRYSTNPTLLIDHRDLHELVLAGVPISWRDEEGDEHAARVRLIDFDDLASNRYLAVNQLTIIIGKKNRRPDVLLFINGLPVGQIELKSPASEKATARAAVNQVGHYVQTIPDIYRYIEIIGVSDLGTARVGTMTTPAEHFAEWKTVDPAEMTGKTQLEVMVRGVFAPERLLDMIRNFVVFEVEGSRVTKVMAKYHQVNAVTRAVEATYVAMQGDKRAGVVWHTTGSGKSWTMVFFATRLRRDPRFANPTLVFVTDRANLDNQLSQYFARTAHLQFAAVQAQSITGGDDSLHALLNRPAGGIIFTTIQKFAQPEDGSPLESISDRANVIVISDEAHRTQYGNLAQNIGRVLPNAVRIGFTGTPIESADRSTSLTFGDYISIYRMEQAQADEATVPIYYESRRVPIAADAQLVDEVADILDAEDGAAATAAISKQTRLEKLVGADDRLRTVVDDIVDHFAKRCEETPGKAMVVGYSRLIAAKLTDLLRDRLGDDAVECVITASADDDPEISKHRKSGQELADLEVDFRKPDSAVRIVVVRDMWLTGYDAPVLHTLYIDKPMKNHGLLQAIARVNRVFTGKAGGLVVDYIGIGDDLRDSLNAYNDDDVKDVAIDLATAVAGMKEKHEVLCDLLYGLDWATPAGLTAGQAATHLINARDAAVELLLEHNDQQVFLDNHAAFKRWYSLAGASPEAGDLRRDKGFLGVVAKAIRDIAPPSTDSPSAVAEQAIKQFFSEGLAAGEVVDVFAIADKDRPEISVLSDDFLAQIAGKKDTPKLQVRLLQKLLNDEIASRLRGNQIQAKNFREEIVKLIGRYEANQLSSAEIVDALVAVARKLRAARKRNEQLGLTEEEAAFYDALAGRADDMQADPVLAQIAQKLVAEIRKDLSVDWTTRENAEASLRRAIKNLLRRTRFVAIAPPPPGGGGDGSSKVLEYYADLIMEQAKAIYERWPETEFDAAVA
jgi:type I restriction enzyme R subunit